MESCPVTSTRQSHALAASVLALMVAGAAMGLAQPRLAHAQGTDGESGSEGTVVLPRIDDEAALTTREDEPDEDTNAAADEPEPAREAPRPVNRAVIGPATATRDAFDRFTDTDLDTETATRDSDDALDQLGDPIDAADSQRLGGAEDEPDGDFAETFDPEQDQAASVRASLDAISARPDFTYSDLLPPLPEELRGLRFSDQRQARAPARPGPYDPLGIRAGRFRIFPSVDTDLTMSDNVLLSRTNRQADVSMGLRPQILVRSDWANHELTLRATADTRFYRELESEDDRAYDLEATGRLDITRRTQATARVLYGVVQEDRSSDDAQASGSRAELTTSGVAAGLSHRFNRLTVAIRSGVTDFDYQDARDGTGLAINNDDRDYRETSFGMRASYAFRGGLTAIADAETLSRDYRSAVDDDGFDRDSEGVRLRAGLAADISPVWQAEVTLGYGRQAADDPQLGEISGLLIDGLLAWRPNALTTVQLDAASRIEETTLANAAGVLTRAIGLELRHALLRELILTGRLSGEWQDYNRPAPDQTRTTMTLAADYALNRAAALNATFTHGRTVTEDETTDYRENRLRLGLRLQR